MRAPTKNSQFGFIAAGLVLVSLFFFTSSPLTITNVILGIVPLLFLLVFGFAIWRAGKKETDSKGD